MRFIYVMNSKDRDKLLELGYTLLKSDESNSVFVFENTMNLNFELDAEMQYVLSDTLTF